MLVKAPVFPERSKTVYLERLGKNITLYEMSVGFKLRLDEDEELGTPINVLIDAGMDESDIEKLGDNTVNALYWEVLELTYPGAKERFNKEPELNDADVADLKKNS